MAVIGTVRSNVDRYVHEGVAGVNDNDIVLETDDISRYDWFHLSCGAGEFDVYVNDGVQWLTAPLSIADLGAVSSAPVISGVALRAYGFRGNWSKIRVRQVNATALTGMVLRGFSSR